jgi:hypothetical protein
VVVRVEAFCHLEVLGVEGRRSFAITDRQGDVVEGHAAIIPSGNLHG